MNEKLDALFIDPPWVISSEKNFWKNIGSCLPSLGMAYIAAYLEKQGFKARIIDCTAQRYGLEELENIFKTMPQPRFVGFSATTPLINNVFAIAKLCRRYFPETVIVAGGVHPTVLPDETLSCPDIDVVVRGEGEETMVELARGKDLGSIAGISFKKDGKSTHNPDRPLIADIDEIPPPAYHLLPMDKYYPATGSYARLPAMSMFATRGCPGRCTFCYRTFYGKVRKRSPENMLREIELLHTQYGIREIQFYDDTFTAFTETVLKFCDLLKKSRLPIAWSCFTRVDFVTEDLLKAMKSAGCHLILFGVESADETILKNIEKRINLDKVREVVRLARKIGIDTRASYMLGNPGETEETIKKTIDFAFKLDTDQAHFNITTAYPGTELYGWAKENGYLLENTWSQYNMSDINLALPTVSRETLIKYYRQIHGRYYFRPRIILRRLFHIRSLAQFLGEVKGFFALKKIFD